MKETAEVAHFTAERERLGPPPSALPTPAGTTGHHPGATTGSRKAPRPRAGAALRAWLRGGAICLALVAPAMVPAAAQFLGRGDGGVPTGFLYYDMPVYMANARQHFDAGGFHWTYGNPCSPAADTPRIYFQPQTLLLGLAWRATGATGAVWMAFGLIAALAGARVALALYREVVGRGTPAHGVGLIAFFWGGGVLAAAGALIAQAKGPHVPSFEELFRLDPARGLWFLNFGRNLVFPTEAYYHALAFGTFLMLLRHRFRAAVLLMALTSLSHPFTGIEVLAIVGAWATVEVIFLENRGVPRWLLGAVAFLTVLHLGYYLGFLKRFPEHRRMMVEWENDWQLQARNFVPAYALVGGLALWGVRRARLAAAVFALEKNRLLLVWSLVAFALANHEFAVKPVQPIHFTRGYIWTPLFLLGAGTLLGLLARGLADPSRVRGRVGVAVLLAALLADNALWLAQFPAQAWGGEVGPARPDNPRPVRITRDARALLAWLGSGRAGADVLLARDPMLSYLAVAETPLRSWAAHAFNTPDYADRRRELADLFTAGRFLPSWESAPVLVVWEGPDPAPGWLTRRPGSREVYRNATYRAFRIGPEEGRGAAENDR